ncbi:MAG: L-glutamate gamma-semialdehyde dehydrogenase [Gemmatimonadaceae bacterium]|nr:L-glutamate gamma-semialdehyde dehydrogenase [Gemmatimonadaceae bacterium]
MTPPLVAPVGASQFAGSRRIPAPINEPVRNYAPYSPERAELQATLASTAAEVAEIPVVVGGRRIHTGNTGTQVMPHAHRHVLAHFHKARPEDVASAIEAAAAARREWAAWSWEDRAGVFLKAAELLTTTHRARVNAATMLGQSKTAHQAEIDAACELIDFWRFNAAFAQEIYAEQPVSTGSTWNQSDYRPLEGFVYAVSPFNFTAIGGNLSGAPALMGNTVLWKPASTAVLSSYRVFQVLEEAGLPPGVINFLPGNPAEISAGVLTHRDLAGVHFTGSTGVFNGMWETIGKNMGGYRSYPRIVGETGGKDFIVAHPSADPLALAVAIVRGAFEYQGQKCSAASRVYVPKSLWPTVRDHVAQMAGEITVGDVRDFSNFMGAVIDRRAFDKHVQYLDLARKECEVVSGGTADGELGWFVQPTLVRTDDPTHRMLNEEIFGPIITAYVYDDDRWLETLHLVDNTSPYALTGAVWAREKQAVLDAMSILRNAAGNFYINDKPTGAVVGQQPFGGARASGTNDKAGSKMNLMRWVSARSIKETFVPPTEWRYPFLAE